MTFIIIALTCFLVFLLYKTARSGRMCGADRRRGVKNWDHINRHRTYARYSLLTTLVLVTVLESSLRLKILVLFTRLFPVHLPFAILLLLGLAALVLWITGLRYPRAHKYLAHPTLVIAFVVVITGLMMLGGIY